MTARHKKSQKVKISFINFAGPRPADAALLRGADSLDEYPHHRTQMKIRIEHRPKQVVSVAVAGFGAKQIIREIFMAIAQLSAQREIGVGPIA
jgi:hypothetical protein